jgi:16S rRNA (uracil1498-N3)-methyltransferase
MEKRLFLPNRSTPWMLNNAPWIIDDPETVHHLVNVQRLKIGDVVKAVDLQAQKTYSARVRELSRKQLMLDDLQGQASETVQIPLPQVTLYACLIKEQAWDIVLQKATELGVHRIQPVESAYTVVKVKEPQAKQARWQRVCRDAALQCERLSIPDVLPVQPLGVLMQDAKTLAIPQWVLMERQQGAVPSLMNLAIETPFLQGGLWVGPEGGWHPDEKQCFQQDPAFQSVHLGSAVLRAETASLAGLTLLLNAPYCHTEGKP